MYRTLKSEVKASQREGFEVEELITHQKLSKMILTICIPTFNRSDDVIAQLNFLFEEIQRFKNDISISVYDNCSTEKDQKKLLDYHRENSFFDLKFQEENLGLIGNIYDLLKDVKADYVWFVGDDDVLLKGVLKSVFEAFDNSHNPDYIFLNHSAFVGEISNIVTDVSMLGLRGYIEDGKKCIQDLFKVNFGAQMFITASIFKTDILQTQFLLRKNVKIEDPLLFAFYCASLKGVYLIDHVFILDRYANSSWQKEAKKVMSWGIPMVLTELVSFGYTRAEIRRLMLAYYSREQQFNYLYMLLKSPFKEKLKICLLLYPFNVKVFFIATVCVISLLKKKTVRKLF